MFQTKIHQDLNWFYYSKHCQAQWNKMQRCTKRGRTKRWEKERPIEAPGSCAAREQNEEIIRFGCWDRLTQHKCFPERLLFRTGSKHTTQQGQAQAKHFRALPVHSVKVAVSPQVLYKSSALTAPSSHRLLITTPFHTDIECLWLVVPEWELTKILAYGTACRGRKKTEV